jgi:uncharacterized protein (TIGR03085 family)
VTISGGDDRHFASLERAALADLMATLGPDAPTLCSGWTTRDLAAHLVVRGSRVAAAGGILIPALAGYLSSVQDRVAAKPWSQLLGEVRKRPWWAPPPLDEAVNRVEYFVHHEDVRRAQPDWRPRRLPEILSAGLWSRVRVLAKLVLRRTPAEITVTASGHGSVVAGRGGARVDLIGEPQELLLFLMGRQENARVELAGPARVVTHMRSARYGI